MKNRILIITMFLVGFALTTQAQTTPRVAKTQVKQQKRIKHGVKNGELTRAEAVRLQKQQANIQRTKKRAKADGVVTRKERAVIKAKQTKASGNIYRKKNNARDRN